MKQKHFYKVSILVLTIVVGCAVAFSCAPASVEKETVKIGFMSPLSGPAITEGEHMKVGYELAVKEINEAGGILGGRMVEPIYGDEGLTADDAITTAKKLISLDKVKAMVMGYWSHTAIATKDLTKEYDLPLVVCGSMAPEVTDKGYWGLARMAITVPATNRPMFRWEEQKGAKTCYFIFGDCDWARICEGLGNEYFAGPGHAKLLETVFFPLDKTDISVEVTRIMSLNPDFIYDFAPLNLQVQFCRLLKEAGYKGDIVFCNDNLSEAHPKVGGKWVEGMYCNMGFVPDFSIPENKKFCEAYYKLAGRYPFGWGNYAYEGAMLMMKAIDKAGTDSNLKAIGDAMHSIDWVTPRGYPMKLAQDGQFMSSEIHVIMAQIVGGEIKAVARLPILPEDWAAR